MGETAQRGLDSAYHYGHIGEEFLECLGVDYGGVFGTSGVAAVGGVGILGAQTLAGGVAVHH